MATEVLKVRFDYDQEVLMPLEANLDNENLETFEELKEKWENSEWGYTKNVVEVSKVTLYTEEEIKELEKQLYLFEDEKPTYELDVIKDHNDTVECDEFNVICFREQAYEAELYSTPYDTNGDLMYFCSWYAYDCYYGRQYSKDFAYFQCEDCGKDICMQNPSNGWDVQYRWLTEDVIVCSKCFEETMMEQGIDIDECIRTEELQGSWFTDSELESAGFEIDDDFDGVVIGYGRFGGYSDPKMFFEKLKEERDRLENLIVVAQYNDMAIGGLGGSITLWVKDR